DLARDLVRHQVAVIAAVGTSAPGLAAKSTTSVIPVVFQTGGDPVQDGLVSRMNRPRGNITGVRRLSGSLEPKRLELLHEAVPKATMLGLLVNPLNPRTQIIVQQMRQPVHSLGLTLNVLEAGTENELDTAFANLMQQGIGALLVAQEPSYNPWVEHIVALAARHMAPAMYGSRLYAAAGGVITHDAGASSSIRQVGGYGGPILKGRDTADMPARAPTNV